MTSQPTRRRGSVASALAASAALLFSAVSANAGPPLQPQTGPLPDLVVGATRLASSLRISSRSFSGSSCSVVEGCVVPGSRRILEFDTQIINYGNADAVLGTPSSRPELFVFSPCHGHYHMLDSLDYSMAFGGQDTVSLYDAATGSFFLKNTNSAGSADSAYGFGAPNMMPIAGDWNADGTSTTGVYDPATGSFFLKNSNAGGPADVQFAFGAGGQGFVPVVGDWDGDGDDTIGLYLSASATFFLKNANAPGPADSAFSYGPAGLVPLAGDWDNNGFDTIGVFHPSSTAWFLRNSNTPGPADLVFTYGPAGAGALVGDWDGQ